MSKILVHTNVLDNVKSEIYGSHCGLWFTVGRHSTDDLILFHPPRMSIDSARNAAAKIALQEQCEYLLFLDDDMIVHGRTLESLKATMERSKADVVMALTYIRGEPFNVMHFKYTDDDKKELKHFNDWEDQVDDNGVFEVDAVGFACALLRVEPLKKLSYPFFITGSGTTEDIYYCIKLKKKFPESKILVDIKYPTGHLLNAEAVGLHNVKELREFYKKDTEKRENRLKDRGLEYMQKCKEMINTA